MELVCAGPKRPSVHSESSAETMWVASIDDVLEQMKNKDAPSESGRVYRVAC